MAIGDAKCFTRDNANKLGRELVLHETLHLLGTTDTYKPFTALPGTDNPDNVMFSLSPNSKMNLSNLQILKEVFPATIGALPNIFDPNVPYQQPPLKTDVPTQQALKKFVNENTNDTPIK